MSTFNKNGSRDTIYYMTKSLIKQVQRELNDFIKNIQPYPDKFKGRGIVMSVGGIKYFTDAWVSINMLREIGCKLPIEVWYKGNELSAECIKSFAKLKVICKDFNDYDKSFLEGYMFKPAAILYSQFKDVVFIDADNICLSDPEKLLDSEIYKETGAVFWQDFWHTPVENPIWDLMKVNFRQMKEQESGQMLINKETCWRELNLCMQLNRMNNIFYKILLGDKDTFRFAWLSLGKDFYYISKEPDSCGYLTDDRNFNGMTMLQYDYNNRPFFLHRNLLKFNATKNNEICWTHFKQFHKDAKAKDYLFVPNNRHNAMDLQGDADIFSFKSKFGNIELRCQDYLQDIRSQEFYREFLFNSYFFNE